MTDEATDTAQDDGGNNRSTIGFPYSHLGDAELVAQALQNRGGEATMDELAAELNTTVKSGAFRTRVATARSFGVTEGSRGKVSLSKLGRRLVDPKEVDAARVDAFLHVPLYSAVYEKYKGGMLPPNKGLEAAIEQMGVSPKQLDRARQTLQRSAERAGFFRHGSDRLVAPAITGAGKDEDPGGASGHAGAGSTVTPVGSLPPVMVEMWLTLLRGDGAKWPAEKVAEFVKTAQRLDKMLASGN